MKSEDHSRRSLLPADSTDLARIRSALQQRFGEQEILLTRLLDGSGAIALLPLDSGGPANAWIIDSCGTPRCKVEVPEGFRNGRGFWDAYYVNGELTAIFVDTDRDFAFVLDEKCGKVIRSYETR